MHKNKRILLGVTGGIAAYKSPMLVRRLSERGCRVRVVMTRTAREFVTPLTLQAVSGHAVHGDWGGDNDNADAMTHIELARWAEQIIIAPASADGLARLAHGRADDLLGAIVLATQAEVAVAPSMNLQMWMHPATQANIQTLESRGVRIIAPGSGAQACGETGEGRMCEPQDIAEQLAGESLPRALDGVATVITAGPTWESLDPVRGFGNRSSGKMGFAFAEAAADCGARVTLISGAKQLPTPRAVRRIDVQSALEMQAAVDDCIEDARLFVAVAAVADYRPAHYAAQKIKRNDAPLTLELIPNPDILATVAARSNAPFCIGFAAESDKENLIANAKKKLTAKGVDVVVANYIGAHGEVFGGDDNAATLLCRDGAQIALAKTDKYRLAINIIETIAPLLRAHIDAG